MGAAASNHSRVSSAEPLRGKHTKLNSDTLSVSDSSHGLNQNDLPRPQSSSSVLNKQSKNACIGVKRKSEVSKTEVITLSSGDGEQNKSNSSLPAPDVSHGKTIRECEVQLAKSESQRLELLDQLNTLKQKNSLGSKPLSVLPPLGDNATLTSETILAKDQYIVKLEKDLQAAQKEVGTVRQKLKKRIKSLNNQLHESRQEASINQMELKAIISQQKEQIEGLKNEKLLPSTSDSNKCQEEDDSSHSKIIVELSNQLSEQGEQIALLQFELTAKSQTIQELEQKLQRENPNPFTDSSSVSVDRLPSGRGKRTHKTSAEIPPGRSSISGPSTHPARSEAGAHPLTPLFERQSTALSDSDSDWELESTPSKIHSAPVGSRIKSAVSVTSSVARDDVATVQGNDDSILNVTIDPDTFGDNDHGSREGINSNHRTKPYKRSALKNHLERKKNAKQSNALIGPSLAFTSKTQDIASDTSCEPTPRCADRTNLPGFSHLHVVKTVSH